MAASGALVGPDAARAETLREALEMAYRTNPTLAAARAGQRATDEGVPIAKASARPALSATADYQEFAVRSANSFVSPVRAVNAAANLSIPLYQGGGVRNGIRAADARVFAGREGLRGAEADVFTAVVTSYVDVIRDDAIVDLNRRNVVVLETNLQASRDRFEIGDLTRTDVAQSEARLESARGQLETARAQLDASVQNYLRYVGVLPEDLQPPPPLPDAPSTADAAVAIAIAENPQLLAAKAQSSAAHFDVRVAAAARLPRVSLVANSNYNNYLGTLGTSIPGRVLSQTQRTATLGISMTIPIYQGGAPGARVRQAQALESQSLEQIVEVERGVVAQARAAFSRYRATLTVIRSAQAAVSANELALEGVRAENTVGNRTVLEILNAEQELLNSRVQLMTARRDAYVTGFALRAAMGRAEAKDLGLFGGSLFDPTLDYSRAPIRGSNYGPVENPEPDMTDGH
ncbi:MAG: hypothetical protein EBR34_08270 [Sphingomonadaceae bacterium]|nr:hypothetical protein [Sphingomonadaceae bacterium]